MNNKYLSIVSSNKYFLATETLFESCSIIVLIITCYKII